MPDAPLNYLDPASIRREKEAAANSPLYWVHPSVTVHAYKAMSRGEQDIINAECRRIEAEKQRNKM